MVVVGDFNVHLGALWGPRGTGDSNVQGVLLFDLLGRCEFSAMSLGSASGGECYTYKSGTTTTTVDYVLMDLAAASMMMSCEILVEADLNTSDHLPLTVALDCSQVCGKEQERSIVGVDWEEARQSGALLDYEMEVREKMVAFQHMDGL